MDDTTLKAEETLTLTNETKRQLEMRSSFIIAFWRFSFGMAAQQINLDIGTHHKLLPCRHGLFLINKKDSWIGRSLELYGKFRSIH